MNTVSVITKTLADLIEKDFRNGFEDSVTKRVQVALYDAGDEEAARDFWSLTCCFDPEWEWKKKEIVDKYGPLVYELYAEAEEMANGEGCFVMPEWGTRGT